MRIIKIGCFILLPLIMGAACERDRDNYDPTSIIGKWEWIYSCGGIVGCTYPVFGQTISLEFTTDSMMIEKINGNVMFESRFCISGDTLKYLRGTNLEYRIEFHNDTLALLFITDGIDNFYKRVK